MKKKKITQVFERAYFKERDKYVNEHKNRYINLYEKELLVYGFEVKFVN